MPSRKHDARVAVRALPFLFVALSAACLAGCGDAYAIRKLVPAATAMTDEEYQAMARATELPREEWFDNKSLTMLFVTEMSVILADDKGATESEESKAEFHWLGVPKPADLAHEIDRSSSRPKTLIHSDRITNVECNRNQDIATGTISFKVTYLCEGRVGYVAIKKNGAWVITELTMPAHGIHIIRNELGTWQRK